MHFLQDCPFLVSDGVFELVGVYGRSPLDLAVVPSCSFFLKRCFPDGCFFVTDDSGHEIRDSLIACV